MESVRESVRQHSEDLRRVHPPAALPPRPARPRRPADQSAVRPGAPPLRRGYISAARGAVLRSRGSGLSSRDSTDGAAAPSALRAPTYAAPQSVRPAPPVTAAAGGMRLGPSPAALVPPPPLLLLLLLLSALGAGAGDAQGEHRADYDREALLGGQVRAGPGAGGLTGRRAGRCSRGAGARPPSRARLCGDGAGEPCWSPPSCSTGSNA